MPVLRHTACRLIQWCNHDRPALLAAAAAAKEPFKPAGITYSPKPFVPLTNPCRDYCRDCAFRRDPNEPGARTMTPEEVREQAIAGEKLRIDVTLPLAPRVGGRPTRRQGAAAEPAAEWVPKGVTVAAAVQDFSAPLLKSADLLECGVIICKDESRAGQLATKLAEKTPGGRAPHDGSLENARIAEQITALLITLNLKHGLHRAGVRIPGLPLVRAPRQCSP